MRVQDNIHYPGRIAEQKFTKREKILYVWNHIPFWIPIVAAFLIICTIFILRNVKQINGASQTSLMKRTILPEEEQLLEGMYCVNSFSSNGSIFSSAEIVGTECDYCITLYSDYAPLKMEATLLSDGTMRCNGLGEGKITYKPSTGSINIVFTKEDIDICEFSK